MKYNYNTLLMQLFHGVGQVVTILWGWSFLNSKCVPLHLVAARLLVSTVIMVARPLVFKATAELGRLLRVDMLKHHKPHH